MQTESARDAAQFEELVANAVDRVRLYRARYLAHRVNLSDYALACAQIIGGAKRALYSNAAVAAERLHNAIVRECVAAGLMVWAGQHLFLAKQDA